MSKSLEELQIGTYANIAMVRSTTPVYVALGIFVQHRVSALPVVDEKGELLGKKREAAWVRSLSPQPSLEGDPVWSGSFGYCILFCFTELPVSPGRVVDIYSKFDVIVSGVEGLGGREGEGVLDVEREQKGVSSALGASESYLNKVTELRSTLSLSPSGEAGWVQGLGTDSLSSPAPPTHTLPEFGSRKDLQQPRCVCDKSPTTSVTLLRGCSQVLPA